MNECINAIETLLRIKKENNKKEPTLAEKSEFMTSWSKLAKENGFAGKAEQFLYEGFGFCGSEPFYLFLKQASDSNDVLRQMFAGRYYGKDSNVTFRVVTHLLALMLNDEASSDLLVPVITHFPSACRNKEGKRLGTAAKTVEKYLLNVLSPAVKLHSIVDLNLSPGINAAFIKTLSPLIGELKQVSSLKEPAVSNIDRIEKWVKDYLGTADAADTYISSNKGKGEESSNIVAGEEFHANRNSGNPEKITPWNLLPDVLIQAQALATQILKENAEQKYRIAELEVKEHDSKCRLEETLKKLEAKEAFIMELNQKKMKLENQCRVLQCELNKKEACLKEMEKEIAERKKMAEVLSRDHARQTEESLQRIASKIKVEYRDFVDALDMPMTIELGENLRFQLMSVFEILEKGGMRIQ